MNRLIASIAFLFWLGFVTISLLTPAATFQDPQSVPAKVYKEVKRTFPPLSTQWNTSNSVHFLDLFFMMILGAIMLMTFNRLNTRTTVIAALSIALYSLAIEAIQEWLVVGRAFEWSDLGANCLGITTAALIFVGGRGSAKKVVATTQWSQRSN